MGYFYLLFIGMMFSFGGSCVKLINPYFAPSMISCLRFAVGVMFLLILKAILRQPFRSDFKKQFAASWKWLLMGGASKLLAYITENTALTLGYSYGNIITMPVQIVQLALIGAFVLKEKLTPRKWVGIALCVIGIMTISLNGKSLADFLTSNLLITVLFILSGCFAGFFMYAQKKVADRLDILDSNLVMFSIGAVLGLIMPAAEGNLLPRSMPNLPAVFAILLFGFITGIGFYLNAKAIPLVPFYMVPLLQSTMVFFTILWGILFFHEPVSVYIAAGTLIFVLGILCMQMPGMTKKKA